jgi:DNA-directed RNA polymerase subunit M/transcription elongation factor TFIIS
MKFCQGCNNVLYPTEIENELWLICKFCEYKEKPKTTVIKKNLYKNKNTSNYGSNQYLIYEYSYQRTKQLECPNKDCPSLKDKSLQEAVMYNDQQNLKMTYICCSCNTEWTKT